MRIASATIHHSLPTLLLFLCRKVHCPSDEPSAAPPAESTRRRGARWCRLRRRQVARRRRPPTPPHPFFKKIYTDGFPMREPGPVADCHELQVSGLNRNRRGRFGHFRFQRLGAGAGGSQEQYPGGLGSLRECGRTCSNNTTFFMYYCGRFLPPFAIRKEYHTHPGPVAPYDATPPAGFPRIFARIRARMICSRQSASLCTRRGGRSPTGPVQSPGRRFFYLASGGSNFRQIRM